MRKVARTLAFAALVPVLVGAEAVYRWVDENGVVNYTQQKPRGVESERIFARAGTPSAELPEVAATEPEPGARQNLTPEQQAMLEDLERAEAARNAELAKIREANCVKSRDVLAKLMASARIRLRDENGEERAMSEEERQSRIDEAQRGIAVNCEATS